MARAAECHAPGRPVLSVAAIGQAAGIQLLLWIIENCQVSATLGNPSYLAAILVMTTILGMGMLVRSFVVTGETVEQRASWSLVGSRLFWAAAVFMGLWALFQTGTRGALVGLVGGAAFMPVALWLWGDRRALRPVLIGAAALLLGAAGFFALDQTVGLPSAAECRTQGTSARLVSTGLSQPSVAIRLETAQSGLQGFLARPLTGWGPGHFGVAYDRYADASVFQYGSAFTDQAHNKVVEEMATKGLLGTVAYLALWGGLLWAIVRRRPIRDEILAYAVLGALGGYFVQNLFLFDTPAMLLFWSLLVAWVASQESPVELAEEDSSGPEGRWQLRMVPSWLKGVMAAGALTLLGLSFYFFSYAPYAASDSFEDTITSGSPIVQQIQEAALALDRFQPLAEIPRLALFDRVNQSWPSLDVNERRLALTLLIARDEPHTGCG